MADEPKDTAKKPTITAEPGILKDAEPAPPPPGPQVVVTDRPLAADPNRERDDLSPYREPPPESLWEILHMAVGPFVQGEIWPAAKFPKYTSWQWLEEQGAIRRVK